MEGDDLELRMKWEGERRSSLNGKSSRSGRSKKLRRRSSGGPETFSLRVPRNGDTVLTRRRGSLPIEVLSHSGLFSGGFASAS
ncbi:hypothetical protein J6590_039799 [Homalodisca vitripennis]|nr:hypothetical protein J6590_039799 [Homalodisca vitripennis]